MSPSVEPFNEAKYKALMDGLDCKEITLKEALDNKDKRIDSQFWTTNIPKNPKSIFNDTVEYRIRKTTFTCKFGIYINK